MDMLTANAAACCSWGCPDQLQLTMHWVLIINWRPFFHAGWGLIVNQWPWPVAELKVAVEFWISAAWEHASCIRLWSCAAVSQL
jgi:hypothetical protein